MNNLVYAMQIAQRDGLGDYVNEEELDPCIYNSIVTQF